MLPNDSPPPLPPDDDVPQLPPEPEDEEDNS